MGKVASLAVLDGSRTVEYAPKANVVMAAELTSPISMLFQVSGANFHKTHVAHNLAVLVDRQLIRLSWMIKSDNYRSARRIA